MELIKEYIYEVTKGLRKSQRKDVEKELYAIIQDMLDEYGTETTEDNVIKVLSELGNPKTLKNRYQNTKRELISEDNYHAYWKVLQITLIAVLISNCIGTMIDSFMSKLDFFQLLIQTMVSLVTGSIFSVGIVTIIFAMIEKYDYKVTEQMLGNEEWSPSSLKSTPSKENERKWNAGLGIAFTSLSLIFINFFPEYLAIFTKSDIGIHQIPIFNLEKLDLYLPIFNATLCFAIIFEILYFLKKKVTRNILLIKTVETILNIIIFVLIFKLGIINPSLLEMISMGTVPGLDNFRVENIAYFTENLFIICIIIAIIDCGCYVYKYIKQNSKDQMKI